MLFILSFSCSAHRLEHNDIGPNGAKALAQALQTNSMLATLE